MSNYWFEEWGDFTIFQFEEKIADAKRFLAKEFDVEESAIQQIRHSQNIGISVGDSPSFAATILGYEVIKDEKNVAYLEGHMSNTGHYINIFQVFRMSP